ncbi:MAG: TetR/AcrR family transcriptional regulator, partial [Acidimicrobiia bacterium]|nr:TetR/AcrR family transcriptional regulator [Acidimicrobiia bacterium]
MTPPSRTRSKTRPPLSADRVFAAAMAVADTDGIDAVAMRRLAGELGVEPMSLYHHVANKDAILDGMVDAVFAELDVPTGVDWREAMRRRARSVRDALARHPWAVTLLESRRNAGPATLGHHDAVLGVLRGAGFSVEMAGHAFAVLDAFIYGFAVEEATLPFDDTTSAADVADDILDKSTAPHHPHLAEFATERVLAPGYDYGNEFDWGLDLILDGLEHRLA